MFFANRQRVLYCTLQASWRWANCRRSTVNSCKTAVDTTVAH